MILDRPVAKAAQEVAQKMHVATSPVLAYIANEISLVEPGQAKLQEGKPPFSRYSVVAGLDPDVVAPDAPHPFGPFHFQSPEVPTRLGDGAIDQPGGIGEIILNDWLAEDLRRGKSAIWCDSPITLSARTANCRKKNDGSSSAALSLWMERRPTTGV